MIYLLQPAATLDDSVLAKNFFLACRDELEQQLGVTVLASEQAARSTDLASSDALVFFNAPKGSYPSWVSQLLQSNVQAFPIAITKDDRFPGSEQSRRQSFDVPDELARRGITEENIATVAAAFCRAMLAKIEPTLSQYDMRIFLSHRRADGEIVARIFHEELLKRVQRSFRDLSAVFVGEDAQEKIEQALIQSDAVIFLETPSAYQSDWIAKELEMALSLNLPIVWISLGNVDPAHRKAYPLPGREPHLVNPDIAVTAQLVDDSLRLAFRLARNSGLRIFDSIRRWKTVCAAHRIEPEVIDRNALLFNLTIPRVRSRYRELPMKHLVQFFGRWPKREDREDFEKTFHSAEADYDAGLMLGPIPVQLSENLEGPVCIDSAEEYVTHVGQLLSNPVPASPRRGIVISGAFPEREPEETPVAGASGQQNLIDAVHAFARAVFERQGTVIFGTHPTFVPLVFEMARRKRPRDFKQAVHLYVSNAFNPNLRDYDPYAVVYAVDKIEPRNAAELDEDERQRQIRNLSLTEMRKKMIQDPQALALVAIGGKYPRSGLIPGVDEEVQLAQEVGLPVFLIGSAPGRAAQLASEHSAKKWSEKTNPLSPEKNEQLRTSLDYGTLAEMVLSTLF